MSTGFPPADTPLPSQPLPTVSIPTSSRRTSRDEGETEQGVSPTATTQWHPQLNRTQSWSEQDMKHQLQQRLMGLEKEKESGFTEIEKG
ncbi:hypothetical protein AJ79_09949 [Helicocarpus griseus UAMH5409]|uniref:Uncharacterized protein n=1 Tax=Helicocarpus griseus UAMH5409 TaxID=1447875 RepID=A0A2B7W7W5_9EURO|nr:hypothetical protein AJ79_09949 [Helicocarpus griseus UAMH5409]